MKLAIAIEKETTCPSSSRYNVRRFKCLLHDNSLLLVLLLPIDRFIIPRIDYYTFTAAAAAVGINRSRRSCSSRSSVVCVFMLVVS